MTESQKGVHREVLKHYDRDRSVFEEFVDINLKLFKAFISENALQVYDIKGYVLDREAVVARLETRVVGNLLELDDLMSIRILTFLEDETRFIAEIIKGEFKVLKDRTRQGALRDSKHFGYAHPCYLTRMLDKRLEWIEYRRFRDFRLEIQIRSMLQHTWMEVQGVLFPPDRMPGLSPESLRDGARVAGLLELADRELNRVKVRSTRPSQSETKVDIKKVEEKKLDAKKEGHLSEGNDRGIPVRADKVEGVGLPKALKDRGAGGQAPVIDTLKDANLSLALREEDKGLGGLLDVVGDGVADKVRLDPTLEAFKEKLARWALSNVSARLMDREISDMYDVPLKFDDLFLNELARTCGHLVDLVEKDLERLLLENTARIRDLARLTFGEPGKVKLGYVARGAGLWMLGIMLAEKKSKGKILHLNQEDGKKMHQGAGL